MKKKTGGVSSRFWDCQRDISFHPGFFLPYQSPYKIAARFYAARLRRLKYVKIRIPHSEIREAS
jgi:hypothetical protein